MGEFSISHILIVSLILLIFFGPSRLPALGQSIGKAIKGFKDAMNENPSNDTQSSQNTHQQISENKSDILKNSNLNSEKIQEEKNHTNKS